MKIVIQNFRCYSYPPVVFEFKDNEITRLDGPSGSGKTTILLSIVWCLFGGMRGATKPNVGSGTVKTENNGNIVIPGIPKTATAVILQVSDSKGGFMVRRTASATSSVEVFVPMNSKEPLKPDAATAWIASEIGTLNLWTASSYIPQGERNPLMMLSNADKFALLYELTFASPPPDINSNNNNNDVISTNYHNSPEFFIKEAAASAAEARALVATTAVKTATARDILDSAKEDFKNAIELYPEVTNYEMQSSSGSLELESKSQARKSDSAAAAAVEMAGAHGKVESMKALIKSMEETAVAKEEELKTAAAKLENLNKNPELDTVVTDADLSNAKRLKTLLEKVVTNSTVSQLKTALPLVEITNDIFTVSFERKNGGSCYRGSTMASEIKQLMALSILKVTKSNCSTIERKNADFKAKINFDQIDTFISKTFSSHLEPVSTKTAGIPDLKKIKELLLARIESVRVFLEKGLSDQYIKCEECDSDINIVKCLIGNGADEIESFQSDADGAMDVLNALISKSIEYEEVEEIHKIALQTIRNDNVDDDLDIFWIYNHKSPTMAMVSDHLNRIYSVGSGDAFVAVQTDLFKIQDKRILVDIKYTLSDEIVSKFGNKCYADIKEFITFGEKSVQTIKDCEYAVKNLTNEFSNIKSQILSLSKGVESAEKTAMAVCRKIGHSSADECKKISEESRARSRHLMYSSAVVLKKERVEKATENAKFAMQKEQDAAKKSVTAAEAARLISEVARDAISDTVNSISHKANIVLAELFKDGGNTMSISLEVTKRGGSPTANSVSLSILHRGAIYDGSKLLSGGETDRLSLALTIAISTLSRSPLVLLDECMASLDDDLRERCFIAIRKFLPTKSVINICHSIASGHHDNVVLAPNSV